MPKPQVDDATLEDVSTLVKACCPYTREFEKQLKPIHVTELITLMDHKADDASGWFGEIRRRLQSIVADTGSNVPM